MEFFVGGGGGGVWGTHFGGEDGGDEREGKFIFFVFCRWLFLIFHVRIPLPMHNLHFESVVFVHENKAVLLPGCCAEFEAS